MHVSQNVSLCGYVEQKTSFINNLYVALKITYALFIFKILERATIRS